MSKMQDLIKTAYKLSAAHNLIGIIYTKDKRNISFYKIQAEEMLEEFSNNCESLFLKSMPTDTEIQVYEEIGLPILKDFRVKESEETLYILTNYGEIGLMY